MINFRLRADMFVAFPRNQLAPFTDNTMPRRDWTIYDIPACERIRPEVDRWKAPETPAMLRRQAA